MHYHKSPNGDDPFTHFEWGHNQGANMVHSQSFHEAKPRVELFLYPPRQMPDQTRRTHQYNFTPQFRMDVQDRLGSLVQGPLHSLNDYRYTSMVDKQSAHSAILPVAQGSNISLKAFSDKWTFILIVDNYSERPFGTKCTPTRMFYSGWIMDEPCMQGFNGAGMITNPNAVLTITHHTKLIVHEQIGSNGYQSTVGAATDYDYIDPMTAQSLALDNDQLYLQDPAALSQAILPTDIDNSMEVSATPLIASVNQYQPNIGLSTDCNHPSNHLGTIIGSMGYAIVNSTPMNQADLQMSGEISPNWGAFASYSRNANWVMTHEIDPAKPITIDQLERHFKGALMVTNTNIMNANYATTDPRVPTRRNVFTSMISNALPPMLVKRTVSEVRFRYNSWERAPGDPIYVREPQGMYHWFGLATAYGGGDDAVMAAIYQLEIDLKSQLWPIIKSTCGEFDVIVHCSLLGSTLVDLVLYDEQNDTGLIETSNWLGGLNSPVIGNLNMLSNNVDQLATSMGDMFATGQPNYNPTGYNNYHPY